APLVHEPATEARGQKQRQGQADHEVGGEVVPGRTADVVGLAREALEVLAEEEVGERPQAQPEGECYEPAETDGGEEEGREQKASRADGKRLRAAGPDEDQDRDAR